MAKTKHRVLSLLLSLAMVLTLLPANALAWGRPSDLEKLDAGEVYDLLCDQPGTEYDAAFDCFVVTLADLFDLVFPVDESGEETQQIEELAVVDETGETLKEDVSVTREEVVEEEVAEAELELVVTTFGFYEKNAFYAAIYAALEALSARENVEETEEIETEETEGPVEGETPEAEEPTKDETTESENPAEESNPVESETEEPAAPEDEDIGGNDDTPVLPTEPVTGESEVKTMFLSETFESAPPDDIDLEDLVNQYTNEINLFVDMAMVSMSTESTNSINKAIKLKGDAAKGLPKNASVEVTLGDDTETRTGIITTSDRTKYLSVVATDADKGKTLSFEYNGERYSGTINNQWDVLLTKTKLYGTIAFQVYYIVGGREPSNLAGAGDQENYGPSKDNTPLVTVNVNIDKLLSIYPHGLLTGKEAEGNHWAITYDSCDVTREVWWAKVLECMDDTSIAALEATGVKDTYEGYVLKYQAGGSYHLDGALTVDPPVYSTVLYVNGELKETINVTGAENAPSKATLREHFESLIKADFSNQNITFDWTNMRFTVGNTIYQMTEGTPTPSDNGSINGTEAVKFWKKSENTYYLAEFRLNYEEADHQDITLTYDANGGTGGPGTETKKLYTGIDTNVTFTVSSTQPTRDGYTFLGWADSASATKVAYQPNSSITTVTNKTIYAVWSANNYTVTYNANGGSKTIGGATTDKDVVSETVGTTHEVSASTDSRGFTKTNYTFNGWYEDAACTKAAPATVDSETELFAKWVENTATISYVAVTKDVNGNIVKNSPGGSVNPASENIDVVTGEAEGSTATVATPADGTAYYFAGWYDNANCTGTPVGSSLKYVPTKEEDTIWTNTTYYALFSAKPTVTVTASDVIKDYNGQLQTFTDASEEVTITTADGYVVTGLTYSVSGKDAGQTTGSFTGTATVMKDGKDVTNQVTLVTEPGKLTINKLTVNVNLHFKDRAYEAGVKTVEFDAEKTTYTGVVSGETLTVTVTGNNTVADDKVADNKTVTPGTVTLGGDAAKNYTRGTVTPNPVDIWGTVSYVVNAPTDANGTPTAAPTDETHYKNGAPIILKEYSDSNVTNYNFLGWAASKSGDVLESPQTMGDASVTYYGVWEAISYTVKYFYDGDEDVDAAYTVSTKVKIDDTINTYTDKSKKGDVTYALDYVTNYPLTVDRDTSKNVINVYYATDNIGTTNPDEGDNIPDKYQATVNFEVVNGTWAEGGNAPKKQVYTVYTKGEDGTWTEVGATLSNIPTGMRPNGGYHGGSWDVVPTTETAVVDGTTYTYTFTANAPDLTVIKRVSSDTATVDDELSYTIQVINSGNVALDNVTVTDTMWGSRVTSITVNGTTTPITSAGYRITSLAVGSSVVITYTYTVTEDDVEVGEIANSATATADGGTSGTDSIDVTVEDPSVDVTKTFLVNGREATTAEVGDEITYEIEVRNGGDVDLTGVVVSDSMMVGTITVTRNGVDSTAAANGSYTIGNLAVGETVTITYTHTVTRTDANGDDSLQNVATVTARTEDSNVPVTDSDRTDTDIDEYRPNPDRPTNPTRPSGDNDDTTDIVDEEVPLAELPGLNTVDHFAYITGYEDGTVRPEGYISRAEVATIFFRLMTDEYRETYWSTTNLFTDVTVGSWYNNAISTTGEVGWINGYPDDTYRPNNYITRAEFATIAARFLSEEYDGENMFTDIGGHWAAEYINRAARAGWITGYAGLFRPDDYITRAEAVTLINRMLDRAPDADHMLANMVRWPDNPETAWYYEAIQEATNSHDYDRETIIDFETWTELLPNRDWAALEEVWAQAGDAAGGEVADGLFPDGNDNN